MTEIEKAWLAGFVDGEGHVAVRRAMRRGRYTYSITLAVTNTNKAVMEYICLLCGGGFRLEPREDRGNRKDCYYWQLCSKRAAEILTIILPYLVVKKEQASNALTLDKTIRQYKGSYKVGEAVMAQREFLYQKSRNFTKRGRLCELG